MPKPFVPKIVSANDLLSGRTVFLSGNSWVSDHHAASVAASPEEAARLLRLGEPQEDAVVGPYLVDVHIREDGTPEPIELREIMRVTGPTVKNGTLTFTQDATV